MKILLTPQNIIAFDESQYELSSKDLNAMFNILNSRCRTPEVDYWIPVCFPSIAEGAFLHMYYRSISKGSEMGLVLLSSSEKNVGEAVQMCEKIEIVTSSLTFRVFKKRNFRG